MITPVKTLLTAAAFAVAAAGGCAESRTPETSAGAAKSAEGMPYHVTITWEEPFPGEQGKFVEQKKEFDGHGDSMIRWNAYHQLDSRNDLLYKGPPQIMPGEDFVSRKAYSSLLGASFAGMLVLGSAGTIALIQSLKKSQNK